MMSAETLSGGLSAGLFATSPNGVVDPTTILEQPDRWNRSTVGLLSVDQSQFSRFMSLKCA